MGRDAWLVAAERLEKTAESLRKRAAPKLDPGCGRQNLTPRRARMAAGMVEEGRRLEEMASAAENLAAEHRSLDPGACGGPPGPPRLLAAVRTAKDLELIRLWGRQGWADLRPKMPDILGSHAYDRKRLIKLGITSNVELAEAARLLAERSERREPTREEKVKELERGILGIPIPGFFPTPEPVGRRMVELAEIKPGDLVLEPSAGKGDLIELALEAGAVVRGVEISSTLLGLLEQRFFPPDVVISQGDFLEQIPKAVFDVVLMNPPFEKGQDAEHVQRAYHYLRPGGRLVAIVSEGLFFRTDQKATDCRRFLKLADAEILELEPGAFKGAESFRQTGVAARLILVKRG